ncbi:MAG: hypothetical protein LIP01_03095 [Tannerellaceae bacterium]|nr:hypothetical protein [Tannerellaceae bacterium]
MEWNNFDLSMIWSGVAGVYYYFLESGYNSPYTSNENAIGLDVANNRYFYDVDNPSNPLNNQGGAYPRLSNAGGTLEQAQNGVPSTRWIYNASYLKLKNLQIGYTIPSRLTERIKIDHVRVFASGENLLTFTPYPFMDPERGAGIGYLPMRQFAFGLTVNF